MYWYMKKKKKIFLKILDREEPVYDTWCKENTLLCDLAPD